MRKTGLFMHLAALSAMMGGLDYPQETPKKASNYYPKPTPKRPPSGTKEYFFDAVGQVSMEKTDSTVFSCYAINEKNAIRKFNKLFKSKK